MQIASDAKTRKLMSSIQAPRTMSVSGGDDVPQATVQPANGGVLAAEHAADPEQSRPAANVQQPSTPAADLQQPGPSRLSAPISQQLSPFPQWSESDTEENEFTLNSEDDMLLAPGQVSGLSLSSSSDETEVLKHKHYYLQHPMIIPD